MKASEFLESTRTQTCTLDIPGQKVLQALAATTIAMLARAYGTMQPHFSGHVVSRTYNLPCMLPAAIASYQQLAKQDLLTKLCIGLETSQYVYLPQSLCDALQSVSQPECLNAHPKWHAINELFMLTVVIGRWISP